MAIRDINVKISELNPLRYAQSDKIDLNYPTANFQNTLFSTNANTFRYIQPFGIDDVLRGQVATYGEEVADSYISMAAELYDTADNLIADLSLTEKEGDWNNGDLKLYEFEYTLATAGQYYVKITVDSYPLPGAEGELITKYFYSETFIVDGAYNCLPKLIYSDSRNYPTYDMYFATTTKYQMRVELGMNQLPQVDVTGYEDNVRDFKNLHSSFYYRYDIFTTNVVPVWIAAKTKFALGLDYCYVNFEPFSLIGNDEIELIEDGLNACTFKFKAQPNKQLLSISVDDFATTGETYKDFTNITCNPSSGSGTCSPYTPYCPSEETDPIFTAWLATSPLADFMLKDGTNSNADFMQFNTSATPVVSIQGLQQWMESEGTFEFGLKNGVRWNGGEEIFFYGKATENIANGSLCQFAGAQGDHILIKKVVPSEVEAMPHLLIGVATHNMVLGEFGYSTWFGKVNNVYTKTPANGDSVNWLQNDILYFDIATGQLTKTMPTVPNRIITVAAVIKEQTGNSENGIIIVRPTIGNKIMDADDVNGTALTTDGQILTWHNAEGYFDVDKNINDYQTKLTTSPDRIAEITKEHTGFPITTTWTGSVVSVVNTDKLRLVVSASSAISSFWRGVETVIGTSITATSTEVKSSGLWYCYSTDGVNFILTKTPFYIYEIVDGVLRCDLMLYEFWWDNVNNTTLWKQPEFHGLTQDGETHYQKHEEFGTRWVMGLDFSYSATSLPTTVDNDKRIKLTSGEIHDEDIHAYINHSATPTKIWEQLLGSVGTAPENYLNAPIFYRKGTNSALDWGKIDANSFGFYPTTANVALNYNKLTGASWEDYTTSAGASVVGGSAYVNMWLVGTTNEVPICWVAGRISSTSTATVNAEGAPNLLSEGLFTEYKILARFNYRNSGSTAGKAQLISITDLRRDSSTNNASVTATPSASMIPFTATSKINASNVQSAFEVVNHNIVGYSISSATSGTFDLAVNSELTLTTSLTNSHSFTVTPTEPTDFIEAQDAILNLDVGVSLPTIAWVAPAVLNTVVFKWRKTSTIPWAINKSYTFHFIWISATRCDVTYTIY